MIKLNCFSCGKELTFAERVGLRDECLHCHADVHVCKNCLHYDPNSYNECREPVAERVREKERSNYCDFFRPGGQGKGASGPNKDFLSAAEALFKKKS